MTDIANLLREASRISERRAAEAHSPSNQQRFHYHATMFINAIGIDPASQAGDYWRTLAAAVLAIDGQPDKARAILETLS